MQLLLQLLAENTFLPAVVGRALEELSVHQRGDPLIVDGLLVLLLALDVMRTHAMVDMEEVDTAVLEMALEEIVEEIAIVEEMATVTHAVTILLLTDGTIIAMALEEMLLTDGTIIAMALEEMLLTDGNIIAMALEEIVAIEIRENQPRIIVGVTYNSALFLSLRSNRAAAASAAAAAFLRIPFSCSETAEAAVGRSMKICWVGIVFGI